jgi:CarD family transcriptional regulator
MYNVDDVVLYGANGVCRISEITNKKFGSTSIEYYVLKPLCSQSSTLFVPTANEQLVSKMRYVLSAEEINDILSKIEGQPEWISDKNTRFEFCKEVILSGDLQRLVELVRSLRFHEKAQHRRGKHLHISDERFLKEAEKMVCDEISLVLNMERSQVVPMLLKF